MFIVVVESNVIRTLSLMQNITSLKISIAITNKIQEERTIKAHFDNKPLSLVLSSNLFFLRPFNVTA